MEEYKSKWQCTWYTACKTRLGTLDLESEGKLKKNVGVSYLTHSTNSTLPIQIAIKALELKDEIITTPFSDVATTSFVWENCSLVCVDIHPNDLTNDEEKMKKAGTDSGRYFHPTLVELPYFESQKSLIAKQVDNRTLCLSLFVELTAASQLKIVQTLLDAR